MSLTRKKDQASDLSMLLGLFLQQIGNGNRAELESIEKIEPAPSHLAPAVDATQLAINEVESILKDASHLKNGEKACYSIMTRRSGTTDTTTHALNVQLEPQRSITTSYKKT